MGIPINIQKIKVDTSRSRRNSEISEEIRFLISLYEKGQKWKKTIICDRNELIKFRDEIDDELKALSTAEALNISSERGGILEKYYKTDALCQSCSFQITDKCITCIFKLQSPLERQLFIEMTRSQIKFQTQYPLDWFGNYIDIEGKSYHNKLNNFKDVLTVVDFYINNYKTKLCIYTDGHTYHERTEEQAQRDRRIDRKLQELGFQVLRYTGKDVKENLDKIILDIKKWLT